MGKRLAKLEHQTAAKPGVLLTVRFDGAGDDGELVFRAPDGTRYTEQELEGIHVPDGQILVLEQVLYPDDEVQHGTS